MNSIWCGVSAEQLGDRTFDLIVFPEGVSADAVADVSRRRPAATVVAAFNNGQGGRMRGVIWHCGSEKVAYDKVCSDGRTPGGPTPDKVPVYSTDQAAIGVVVCCDLKEKVLNDVLAKLSVAAAPFKAICIPADMWDASWFSVPGPVGYPGWGDVHVVLSNGPGLEGGARPPSFITNERRERVRTQEALGDIWISIDDASALS